MVQLSLLFTKSSSTSLIIPCVYNDNAKLLKKFYINVNITGLFYDTPRLFHLRLFLIAAAWFGEVWVGWKRTKSREAGMWGLKPFRGTTSGIKPENEFLGFPRSRQRWGAKQPTHIPRLPKKKPLHGKKSASPKINCAYSLQNWILWCQPLKEYDFGVVNNISFNKQNCQPKSVHVSAYLPYDAVVFLW